MVDSVTVGSNATYTCDQAYTLVGQPTRTCVRNGADTMWSGQAPTCQCKRNMYPCTFVHTAISSAAHSCTEYDNPLLLLPGSHHLAYAQLELLRAQILCLRVCAAAYPSASFHKLSDNMQSYTLGYS